MRERPVPPRREPRSEKLATDERLLVGSPAPLARGVRVVVDFAATDLVGRELRPEPRWPERDAGSAIIGVGAILAAGGPVSSTIAASPGDTEAIVGLIPACRASVRTSPR